VGAADITHNLKRVQVQLRQKEQCRAVKQQERLLVRTEQGAERPRRRTNTLAGRCFEQPLPQGVAQGNAGSLCCSLKVVQHRAEAFLRANQEQQRW
jgi:hypothetical protein